MMSDRRDTMLSIRIRCMEFLQLEFLTSEQKWIRVKYPGRCVSRHLSQETNEEPNI